VSLSPAELSWVRLGGLFKPVVLGKRLTPIGIRHGAHAWDGAIAALRTEAAQWSRDNAIVRVVLSNHFVRYALAPWRADIHGSGEELALARHHFARVHGEACRQWDIRLSPAPGGGARIASAVDTALIEALRAIFPRGQRARLASVQPLLMSAVNSGGARLTREGAWLIVAEARRTCLALISSNTWHAVHNVTGRFADPEAWVALVERERWRVNLDHVPRTLWVHAPSSPAYSPRTVGAWKLMFARPRWPAGFSPARDSAYTWALGAA
jgi:hypothetical protein